MSLQRFVVVQWAPADLGQGTFYSEPSYPRQGIDDWKFHCPTICNYARTRILYTTVLSEFCVAGLYRSGVGRVIFSPKRGNRADD